MARDMIEEAFSWPRRLWEYVKTIRLPIAATAERRGLGLSAKLLLLTVMFVMLAEVLIFVLPWRIFAYVAERPATSSGSRRSRTAAGEGRSRRFAQ